MRILFLLVLMLLVSSATSRAAAQVAPPDTLTPVVEPIPREAPAPRAAFIRALLVPGWGHYGMGEYRRGTVYVALQGSSWAMLFKTMHKLGQARDDEGAINALAVDSLAGAMAADTALAARLSDPAQYEAALLTYPGLQDARSLVESRERHRQDWIVYTLFFTFAGAVDAYVTAHLADFPVEITATRSRDGGSGLRFSVPVGGRR